MSNSAIHSISAAFDGASVFVHFSDRTASRASPLAPGSKEEAQANPLQETTHMATENFFEIASEATSYFPVPISGFRASPVEDCSRGEGVRAREPAVSLLVPLVVTS